MEKSRAAGRVEEGSTTGGLPVSPSMGPALAGAGIGVEDAVIAPRIAWICLLTIGLGVASAYAARLLGWLIALITNAALLQRLSFSPPSAAQIAEGVHRLGWWVAPIPVAGALVVGFMARFGHEGIRGHGIPEAMDNVLTRQSRIPPRLTFLKPLSAAIAIGTGGPFGAEGPIIATGGAIGSLLGQLLSTTAGERKTLLAAGAAAGMAATFGSPVAATLLAVELLLFEFRPRSLIPVALASFVAAGLRFAFHAPYPVFPLANLTHPTLGALASYVVIGGVVGVASVGVTRAVYAVEDAFEKLPIHWMWWPAIGAMAVGVIGRFAPRTLSVGYDNITDAINGSFAVRAALALCLLKFCSWAVALGSGTSGGTLAPLFTLGSALGAVLGVAAATVAPALGIDVRVAALVGMAAMFAGASRALLTSVVFAFETTNQPLGLLPLLGGCTTAFYVSSLLMRETIMTAKVARRGVRVPAEYGADFLDAIRVGEVASAAVATVQASQTVADVRQWLLTRASDSRHHGFPVLDEDQKLLGVVTRRRLLDPATPPELRVAQLIDRPPLTVHPADSLRCAADLMLDHDVGQLAVVERAAPDRLAGIVTREDLLAAHRLRKRDDQRTAPHLRLPRWRRAPKAGASSAT